MLTALLVTVLPTLLFAILLPKFGLRPKSTLFYITLAWFAGMFFFTMSTAIVAVAFAAFTTDILLKATYAMLLLVQITLLFLIKDAHGLFLAIKQRLHAFTYPQFKHLLLIFGCFLFAFIFYTPHLAIKDGILYTSPIYWDFHWHAALINNFAYGDNFPPENEAFAGLPHTYHYFWGVISAIYIVSGLNLAQAINFISILAFFFILIGIIGLSEELFHSRKIGVIAVILTITSSSLHFIHYFAQQEGLNLGQIIYGILANDSHPWYASFLPGNALDYNGTMYNLFYLLEERQMIFGVVYLLVCSWIIWKRDQFSNKLLFILGMGMGAYFLWHLHITIMVLCALIFLLVFAKDKKKTFFLLAGFAILFGGHYLYFKSVMKSDWFYQDITGFPRLNFEFASGEHEPFSFKNFIIWYGFSYGLKLLFIVMGSVLIFRKNRQLFLLLSAIIIPTFILLNSIQLSPASIYENHKWLRPMNIFIDILAAYAVYIFFFANKRLGEMTAGIVCLFFLTISGIIETTPFLNSKPAQVYAEYPSSITTAVSLYSVPGDTFIGTDTREINLAGRKVFLGNNLGGEMRFKKKERKEIIDAIYKTTSLPAFCTLTKKYDIQFVEFDKKSYSPLKELAMAFPNFKATNKDKENIYFVDVSKSCR